MFPLIYLDSLAMGKLNVALKSLTLCFCFLCQFSSGKRMCSHVLVVSPVSSYIQATIGLSRFYIIVTAVILTVII